MLIQHRHFYILRDLIIKEVFAEVEEQMGLGSDVAHSTRLRQDTRSLTHQPLHSAK
jgi:hypothetical protein